MKRIMIIALVVVIGLCAVGYGIYYSTLPGGLPAVWTIEKADQSDVGKTVSLSFSSMFDNGGDLFVYVFDPQKDSGRLAVFSLIPNDIGNYLVTVYAPEWTGADGLCKALDDDFPATVVSVTNVSMLEAQYLLAATYYSKHQVNLFDDSEFLDIYNPAEPDNDNEIRFYFGRLSDGSSTEKHWSAITDDLSVCIVANSKKNGSEQFHIALDNFLRTVRRFWLQNELGL